MFVSVGDHVTLHFEVIIEPQIDEVEITDEDQSHIRDYICRYFYEKCHKVK